MRVKILYGLPMSVTLFAMCGAALAAPLNVGSKRFTESYILGEILKQTAAAAGETTVVH
jgi:glycine betaine/choline ABC-type transport system substrate-binding protein